ncbi:transporter [Streptomyces sp. NPDC048197]|uniref:transporter n=1 Tax=Streptomyces sp. NPDC048197 TaxID=3365511 RepID=UPI0037177AB0
MSNLKAFRVRDGRATEITGSSMPLERHLQTLIEDNMEEMIGIRFLASEYATGRHRGRIDSLGLDENGAPALIEYKRSRDQNVTNQALSYLSWLHDHHHEFESLVRAKLGVEVVESVDWSNPRLVCIAGDFTHHDTVAIEMIGRRIDLVSYRVFDDVLTLQLVASVAGTPSRARGKTPEAGHVVSVSSPKSVQQYLDESPQDLQELFAGLNDVLLSHDDVRMEPQLHYFAYRRIKNVATVRIQPRNRVLVVNLKLAPDTVELQEGFSRDVRGLGCLGIRDGVEVRIRSREDLARASDLIRRGVAVG